MITIIITYIIIIGAILSSKTVKIQTIDNQKVVVEIYGIPDPMAYYYKYINSFLKSYNTIMNPTKSLNSSNSSNIDIVLKFNNRQNHTN